MAHPVLQPLAGMDDGWRQVVLGEAAKPYFGRLLQFLTQEAKCKQVRACVWGNGSGVRDRSICFLSLWCHAIRTINPHIPQPHPKHKHKLNTRARAADGVPALPAGAQCALALPLGGRARGGHRAGPLPRAQPGARPRLLRAAPDAAAAEPHEHVQGGTRTRATHTPNHNAASPGKRPSNYVSKTTYTHASPPGHGRRGHPEADAREPGELEPSGRGPPQHRAHRACLALVYQPPVGLSFIPCFTPSHFPFSQTSRQVRRGQAHSHKGRGWEQFTDAVIRELDKRKAGLVFLLWGKPAQEKCRSIDKRKHKLITCAHPSPLSATKTSQPFIGSKCFSRCNQALVELGQKPIDWNVL